MCDYDSFKYTQRYWSQSGLYKSMNFDAVEAYLRGSSISDDSGFYSWFPFSDIKKKILDHPFGYRKLTLQQKSTRMNPSMT